MPARPWWLDLETRADRFERHVLTRASAPPTDPPATTTSAPEDDFQRIVSRFIAEMERLTARAVAGALDLEEWDEVGYEALTRAHADSYALGRTFGGNAATEEEIAQVAQAVADLESYYLRGFQNDIASGMYEDREDQAARRAASYAGRARGTANGGFVDGSPDTAQFYWQDTDDERECEDCPILAEASPYGRDDIPAVPGSNDTPCLFNCRCRLVRDDGAEGFNPS